MVLNITYDISTSSLPGFVAEVDGVTIWFCSPVMDPDVLLLDPRNQKYMGADLVVRAPAEDILLVLRDKGFTGFHDEESFNPGEVAPISALEEYL